MIAVNWLIVVIMVIVVSVNCYHEFIDDELIAAIDDKTKSKMCDPNVINDNMVEKLEKCDELFHRRLENEFIKLEKFEQECDNHTDTFMDKFTKLQDEHYRHHLSDVCAGHHKKCHAQMKQKAQDIITKNKNVLNGCYNQL
ncbi:unnamed protein product [Oppiella nova]|uniref:Uncharacterized protein n=1 Tax=Oppiella nova TaxID=334625 RepID=A0A7R9L9U8_9ACAR|nr:unnamed protein product [Oppiella nova]CAG2160934.1 unnamed protein product [Oppiella nova]